MDAMETLYGGALDYEGTREEALERIYRAAEMYAKHYLRFPQRLEYDDPRAKRMREDADALERDLAFVAGRCFAVIHHGPGHQSKTRCELSGKSHKRHQAIVGNERMTWGGDKGSTGFFDEAPEDDDE